MVARWWQCFSVSTRRSARMDTCTCTHTYTHSHMHTYRFLSSWVRCTVRWFSSEGLSTATLTPGMCWWGQERLGESKSCSWTTACTLWVSLTLPMMTSFTRDIPFLPLQQLTDSFRLTYCHLWRALLNRDDGAIKQYCLALNAKELYPLLACMVTARAWDKIQSGIISNSQRTRAEV